MLGCKQFLNQFFYSTEIKAPAAQQQAQQQGQQQKPGMMMVTVREDLKQGGTVQGLGQTLKDMSQEGRSKLAQLQTMVLSSSAKWLAQFGADGDDLP